MTASSTQGLSASLPSVSGVAASHTQVRALQEDSVALKTSTHPNHRHRAPSWAEMTSMLRPWALNAPTVGQEKGYSCRPWWNLDSTSSPECWRCLTWVGALCRCRLSLLWPSQRPYWCSVQTGWGGEITMAAAGRSGGSCEGSSVGVGRYRTSQTLYFLHC